MIDYRKTEPNIVELNVSGRVTRADIEATFTKLKSDLPPAGKIRVLEVIDDLRGIDAGALWEDMRLGLPMLDQVERAAIVTDSAWIESLSNFGKMFTSAKVRIFEPSEIAKARAWLTSA